MASHHDLLPVVTPMCSRPGTTSISAEWGTGIDPKLLGPRIKSFSLQWRAVDASSWESTEASMSLQNLKCVKGGLIPGTYYTFRVRARSATSDGAWGRPSDPMATLNADGTEVQGAPPQMPPCEAVGIEPDIQPSAEVNCRYSESVSELKAKQQAEAALAAETPHSREPSRGLAALVKPRKSRPGAAGSKVGGGSASADLDSSRDSECGILIKRERGSDDASDAAVRGGPARGSTATPPANGGAGQSVTKPGGRTSARPPRVCDGRGVVTHASVDHPSPCHPPTTLLSGHPAPSTQHPRPTSGHAPPTPSQPAPPHSSPPLSSTSPL